MFPQSDMHSPSLNFFRNSSECVNMGSTIPELQNQVMFHDVTNRVTNSKILFAFYFFS